MVEDLVVSHTIEFLFTTNSWELILKEVDIARFNFCHVTIRVLPVHHISFEMCEISYEHHLGSFRTMFYMFIGWLCT